MHTKTRSISPSGSSATSATVRTPSTSSPCRLVPKTAALVTGGEEVVQGRRSRTCRDAWRRRRRGRRGARTGRGTAPRSVPGGRSSMSATRRRRARPARRRRPASRRAPTISGLTSTLTTSPRSAATRPRATSVAARASRSTACSPRNSPSRRWVASWSIISWAVTWSTGAGRNTTSATASARMPPTPSITVGPNCGSRTTPAISSRLPRTIGATSTPTSPSCGRGRGEQLAGGAAHRVGVAEAEPNEPALGLVGDRVAVELGDDRDIPWRRRRRRPRRRSPPALGRDGHPVAGEQALGLGLGEGAARHRRRRLEAAGARCGGSSTRERRRRCAAWAPRRVRQRRRLVIGIHGVSESRSLVVEVHAEPGEGELGRPVATARTVSVRTTSTSSSANQRRTSGVSRRSSRRAGPSARAPGRQPGRTPCPSHHDSAPRPNDSTPRASPMSPSRSSIHEWSSASVSSARSSRAPRAAREGTTSVSMSSW